MSSDKDDPRRVTRGEEQGPRPFPRHSGALSAVRCPVPLGPDSADHKARSDSDDEDSGASWICVRRTTANDCIGNIQRLTLRFDSNAKIGLKPDAVQLFHSG